jgi:hypothetical protein
MTYIGFIYIWYDKLKKFYYIGSHKGTVNDGYICSSSRMINAYKKRPFDFKRRVIMFSNNLIEDEQKYLNMIKNDELLYGKTPKYYNVKRFAAGGDTIQNLPNKMDLIKKRYGKKHRDAIKKAIKNRSPEKEKLHQERRKLTLKKTFNSPNYKNYQDKPFKVYKNNVLLGLFRNKTHFSKTYKIDRGCVYTFLQKKEWTVKQRRKHPFIPGDILKFVYI